MINLKSVPALALIAVIGGLIGPNVSNAIGTIGNKMSCTQKTLLSSDSPHFAACMQSKEVR